MKLIAKTTRIGMLAILAMAVLCTSAYAVSMTGDGLNSLWVSTTVANKPDNVAEARALLATGTPSASFVAPYIDYADAAYGGAITSAFFPQPVREPFAVSYTGYLEIATAGSYDFRAFTDDGFQMNIDGTTIFQFDGNRAPGASVVLGVGLAAGFLDFEFISWDQGGAFANELAWRMNGDAAWSVVPQGNFYSANPIPEPMTLVLVGSGLLGMAGLRRRIRKQ